MPIDIIGAMARSKKKTPIHGITSAVSEAQDKALWHRAYRRGERQRIQQDADPVLVDENQYSSPWKMDKDGKVYVPDQPTLLRK
ncbi:hypothetical protein [Dyella humicola]|uniref:hypothetical protein n=1 Tax=Dyella humicola TaxID=2992126 RepID=UPI0022579E6A|nr:hypothetical protein [Dyella humicola]